MSSRFKGRDYATLRKEILDFLKQRLPQEWDSTNLGDPVVIFAESLARVGDQLHFTIDELRRECDIATAQRASSVYSYAMREGYRMMLPKGSSGTIHVNSENTNNHLHLKINKFDPINCTSTPATLYSLNDIDADLQTIPTTEYIESLINDKDKNADYATYCESITSRTQRINVVLGTKEEFNFTYNNINIDSTVELPDAIIDRDLIRLTVYSNASDNTGTEWKYVNDIIGSGFVGRIYTLTPKFIGGAITLNIEFATNYKDLFTSTTRFKFEYIKISDQSLTTKDTVDLMNYITPSTGYEDEEYDDTNVMINLGNGIKGYTEYEDANVTRANYKNFIQDYSALLTKDDFVNYIKATSTANCKVFDHSDNYKTDTLPPDTSLLPRVIYIITDAEYTERERLFYDLRERSSRSDCICLIPYGKDPYTIVVKAECFLLGTSASSVATQIKSAILQYYSDSIGGVYPKKSMISYLAHKASDKVISLDSLIIRDSMFGKTDTHFDDIINLSNKDMDALFDSNSESCILNIKDDDNYKIYENIEDSECTGIPDAFPLIYDAYGNVLDTYDSIIRNQYVYGLTDFASYDVNDSDIFVKSDKDGEKKYIISDEYKKHHYLMPYLNKVIVMVKAISN